MPEHWQGHLVFHHNKLKPCITPQFPKQAKLALPLEPEFVDGEPEYEVSEVLGEKRKGNHMYFLVHWEGYRLEEDTWEPKENLAKVKEAIKAYRSQGQGPRGGGHNVRNWPVTPTMSGIKSPMALIPTSNCI